MYILYVIFIILMYIMFEIFMVMNDVYIIFTDFQIMFIKKGTNAAETVEKTRWLYLGAHAWWDFENDKDEHKFMREFYFLERLMGDNISVNSYLNAKYEKMEDYQEAVNEVNKAVRIMKKKEKLEYVLNSCNSAAEYFEKHKDEYESLIDEYDQFKQQHFKLQQWGKGTGVVAKVSVNK